MTRGEKSPCLPLFFKRVGEGEITGNNLVFEDGVLWVAFFGKRFAPRPLRRKTCRTGNSVGRSAGYAVKDEPPSPDSAPNSGAITSFRRIYSSVSECLVVSEDTSDYPGYVK